MVTRQRPAEIQTIEMNELTLEVTHPSLPVRARWPLVGSLGLATPTASLTAADRHETGFKLVGPLHWAIYMMDEMHWLLW